jgi:hypothetical protein
MKYLRNHNINIHINFYQNRFINECARKKKAKIPEFQSFFVRCRRTYVLNQNISIQVAFYICARHEFEYIALSEGAYTTKYRVPTKWFRSGKDNLINIFWFLINDYIFRKEIRHIFLCGQ